MDRNKLIRWAVPVAVLVVLWCIPTPEGLTQNAWRMFAIFAATIAGILAAPVASGALMFIALAITYFTGVLLPRCARLTLGTASRLRSRTSRACCPSATS